MHLTSPVGSAFDRALAASGDDPAATEARNRYWEARFARSSEIVKRAIGRGELPETTDVRLAIEMLVAPIHFRSCSPAKSGTGTTRAHRRLTPARSRRTRQLRRGRLDGVKHTLVTEGGDCLH